MASPSGHAPGDLSRTTASNYRIAFFGVALTLAIVFLILNRAAIPEAARAARSAKPGFLAVGILLSVAYLICYAGLFRASVGAFGYRISVRRALLLGPAIHFSNMVVINSGGLGGMPIVVAEARRSRQPVAPAVLGYLIAAQLGHLVFALVLVIAVIGAAAEGQLAGIEIAAAGVFALYTVASVTVMATALRSERLFFALHRLPWRLRRSFARLLKRKHEGDPPEDPRELYESINELAKTPMAFAASVVFALLIEVIGVAMLWASLAAFGERTGVVTPLLAYAAGVLFATVGFLPAGLGFAEAGLALALNRAGIPGQTTTLVVVVYRVFEAWLPFSAGAITVHMLARGENASNVSRQRPGIRGAAQRRLIAGAAALLGTFNVLLATLHHPLIRVGRLHERIPHAAVQSSRYALLAAGVALIASAPGLLHGKRQAWLVAVAALAGALVAHPFKRVDYIGITSNAGVLALLASFAAYFPARSDPLRARQGIVWLVLGELGVLVYGVAGLYLLDRHFAGPTTFLDSLEDGVRLLFVLPTTTIEPATRHGSWFIESVRAGAIVIFLVGAYHLFHPVIHRAGSGREESRRVARLLEQYATTSIAHFQLLGDKSYFFAREGNAFIGYRVVGHTAVALGEPIGDMRGRQTVVNEFAEFCDLNGWVFCFHQVTEEGATELRQSGLQSLKIGEEAIIPVQEFVLTGKSFKHLRNTVNRMERDGYVFEVLPSPIPEAKLAELEEISDSWLRNSGHRERAFSLGSFTRAYVRMSAVAVVRAPGGRIEAFANLIPSYNANDGNFDMMRRRDDAPEGSMDFLFVGLISHFRTAGLEGMNLGLAPLSNVDGPGVVNAALRIIYERGGSAFNFKGLRAFKEKWKPRWEPRYLVYRSDAQLPTIALAVARAGEVSGHLPFSFRRKKHVPVPALVTDL